METEIQIKILSKEGEKILPEYATAGSAAVDLVADIPEKVLLRPMERSLIPTGIAIALPEGHAAFVFARSGLATKHGICLANGVGVIDSDYRGEISVGLINLSGEAYEIKPFERIAQLCVTEVSKAKFLPAAKLPETRRGAGGFGSTGR